MSDEDKGRCMMELDNEAMKRRVKATQWLIEKQLGVIDPEKQEYLRRCLNRLVGSCLLIAKRDTPSSGGDAA